MNNLTHVLPTQSLTLNGQSQQLINARDLHQQLSVNRDFSNWIKQRIESYGFVENEDFLCSPNLASGENKGLQRFFNQTGRGGHNRKEYFLTLDMAKELALVENNPQGRKIRKQLIEIEKAMREEIPALLRKLEKQNQALRLHIMQTNPIVNDIRRYFEAGLTQVEMGKLLGKSSSRVRDQLKELAAIGLINYKPNPKLQAQAHKMRLAKS